MKKILFPMALFFAVQVTAQKIISLPVAKFQTGDNPQWATINFDDSKWPSIKTDTRWEPQGYDRYNGYAWYRIRFTLPVALKNEAYWKDSLSFWLGKIDDVDETFLNGVKIGQTGSLPTDPGGYEGRWDANRIYTLPADSKIINWDKENIIAVRVFDNKEGGGMFGAVPFVKLMMPIDPVTVSLVIDTVGLNTYSTTVTNVSGKTVEGWWTIIVKDGAANKIVRTIHKPIAIGGLKKIEQKIKIEKNRRLEISSSFKEKNIGSVKHIALITPYILTPKVALIPRINSPAVFGVRPNSPFLFKVAATGEKSLRYTAAHLPEGLIIDEATGIITGKITTRGDYKVQLTVSNQLGNDVQDFEIKAGDELALTPPMGWNSWNSWGLTISSDKLKNSAQAIIDKGLIDHGWSYINIDDGWQNPVRSSAGEIAPNEKFGSMESLGDWLHNNGLKFGIYTSPGTETCGDYLGSYKHEVQDAATYTKWGVDFVKYDWCSYGEIYYQEKDTSLAAYQKPYRIMQQALQQQPRDMLYSLCQYGMADVWKWGGSVNGNLWRTTHDIRDTWESVKAIGFGQAPFYPYVKPGNWNDPDILVVGQVGWSATLRPTRLTPDEQYAHISLWSLLAAPLLIGCDVSKLDDFTLSLLTNDEVIAINQDVLGKQAEQKIKNNNFQIWEKQLADGSRAIGIFNMADSYKTITFKFSDIGGAGGYKVRDLWRQKNEGVFKDSYTSKIPPHGVTLIKIAK